MKAWLWLSGYTNAADHIFDGYEFYGKPQLVFVSELVGFDWASQDDGRWTNDEDGDGISAVERDNLIAKMKGEASELKNTARVA
jgi:hypothetical protein